MSSPTKLLVAALAAVSLSSCSMFHADGDGAEHQAKLCVISMEDAEGGPTVEFEGQTVSFCCNSCKKRWNKMDDDGRRAAIAKLEASDKEHR